MSVPTVTERLIRMPSTVAADAGVASAGFAEPSGGTPSRVKARLSPGERGAAWRGSAHMRPAHRAGG
jgi:hypothetical protein